MLCSWELVLSDVIVLFVFVEVSMEIKRRHYFQFNLFTIFSEYVYFSMCALLAGEQCLSLWGVSLRHISRSHDTQFISKRFLLVKKSLHTLLSLLLTFSKSLMWEDQNYMCLISWKISKLVYWSCMRINISEKINILNIHIWHSLLSFAAIFINLIIYWIIFAHAQPWWWRVSPLQLGAKIRVTLDNRQVLILLLNRYMFVSKKVMLNPSKYLAFHWKITARFLSNMTSFVYLDHCSILPYTDCWR